jgi:two-component system response regulator YesN
LYHLLIVDDYPDQVESIATTIPFEELGIEEVYKSYSGVEALETMKSYPIDIVITDITMPGMSGLELIEKIRETSKSTKCILLSGYADFEFAQKAIILQTSYYLTKPVVTNELISILKNVTAALKSEWEEISSYQRAEYTFRENLPLLKRELLNQLLQDKRLSKGALTNKMQMLKLPFQCGDQICMCIIRLEDEFSEFDESDLSLMEYAITNIAEEIFGEYFHMWHCKDPYDYIVFVLKLKEHQTEIRGSAEDNSDEIVRLIEKQAVNLHKSVGVYLKRNISVSVFKKIGMFPEQLPHHYQTCISAIRRQIGNESNFFITVTDVPEPAIKGCLKVPYQSPLLIHLLESGRWDKVSEKLEAIFLELVEKWTESPEYAQEILFVVTSSFHYIAHKNGRQLGDIIGASYHSLISGGVSDQSMKQLRDWVFNAFYKIKEDATNDIKDSRSFLVGKIHQFIDENVSLDLSLQAISDHVNLHPTYLSKVYKVETGISLSEYLLKYRMELAANLLQNSNDKIYEIATQMGYQTTHYFIKLFKSYFGMTPQEYRGSLHN